MPITGDSRRKVSSLGYVGWYGLSIGALIWLGVFGAVAIEGRQVERVALRLSRGERYTPQVVQGMLQQVPLSGARACNERALRSYLILGVRHAEQVLAGGQADAIDEAFERVRSTANRLLTCSPGQSFGWLCLYWLSIQAGQQERDLAYLETAYRFSKNELWIASRRLFIAAPLLDTLPDGVRDAVENDFLTVINAREFSVAVNILVGPGFAARDRFLQMAARQSSEIRAGLGQAIEQSGAEISVPWQTTRQREWQ